MSSEGFEEVKDSGTLGKIFSQLETSAVPGKIVTQKTGFSIQGREIYAGRDSDGFPHLLVPADDLPSSHFGQISALIFTQARNLEDGDGNLQSFVDLACHSKDADGVFAPICFEISEALSSSKATNGEGSLKIFEAIIQKWRDVLQALSELTSPKNQKIGVVGELIFLSQQLERHGRLAFDSWFGPDKSRHDFEFASLAYEVKSSSVLHRKICTIHGLNQLATTAGTDLKLVHIQLEEASGGQSVETLIDEITTYGITFSELRKKLTELWPLDQPTAPAWFKDFQVKVVSASIFQVNDTFPKISSVELDQGMLPHFLDVSYKLSLDGVSPTSSSGEKLTWAEVLQNA